MKMIELEHITKDYGKGRGVFDCSFSVEQGEVMGFLGPNGAGKTTTIRQLMGFIRPDRGRAEIGGRDCFREAAEIHRSLGYLPGEIAFMDGMSGTDFLKFMAGMKGMKGPGRTKELMERFELDPSGKLGRMSKGMKQKVGLVSAFMQDAEILILDEPTSGLDPLMQNRFVELLLEEKARGKTILMSSHVFEETQRTCDRAAIIRSGKLVDVECMEKLMGGGSNKDYEITFAADGDAAQFAAQFAERFSAGLRADAGLLRASRKGRVVSVAVSGSPDALLKALAPYSVRDLNTHSRTLEELFLAYYEQEGGSKEETES